MLNQFSWFLGQVLICLCVIRAKHAMYFIPSKCPVFVTEATIFYIRKHSVATN